MRPEALLTLATGFLASVFSLIILLRLTATMAALLKRPPEPAPKKPAAGLPVLTLLVPLYKEGPEVVATLVRSLSELDYPRDKLDVKLLLEADDDGTINGALNCNAPSWFEVIPVPPRRTTH